MPLSAAIYSRLSAAAGVTAIVGNRIYPGLSPEGTFPLCSYAIKVDVDEAINKSPTNRSHVTVSCCALSYSDALNLATAVRAALDRQTWTTGKTIVQSVMFEDSEESGFSEDGSPEQTYREHDVVFNVLSAETP